MKIERGLAPTRYGYIHYRAAGQGEPIMLFHINQQSSALYLELIEQLAPHHRVVAMDYPGHGMSDHVPTQPTIEDYAAAAVEVMDGLGIGRAALLGEAVGTAVSAEICRCHPDRARAAILLNCPLTPSRGEMGGVIATIREKRRPADSSGFPLTRELSFLLEVDSEHAPLHPSQSWMDRINLTQVEAGRDRWQASTAFLNYDLKRGLQGIRCPVLALTSGQSRFADYRDYVASCIADIRSELIPNSRFCMGWECAEEVGRRTVGFLSGLPRPEQGALR